MEKRIVIDADSICFICSKDSIRESIESCDTFMENLMHEVKSRNVMLILSEGKYFRHSINPKYKGNRKPTTLNFVKDLKTYLKQKYGAFSVPSVEADDVVVYLKTKDPDVLVCAIDKDVFGQLPGKHFNYMKWEYTTTSVKDSLSFLFKQSIAGDSGDNIKGVPRIGIKGAEKMLKDCKSENDFAKEALNAYVEKYGASEGVFFFQQNFRQVYLLKKKEDYVNELGFFPKEMEGL